MVDKPIGSDDMQCHLMVQCMEAWLLADRETLKNFSGRGSRKTALPAAANLIERTGKAAASDALAAATGGCKNKECLWQRGALIQAAYVGGSAKVVAASPWARRLIETLKNRLDQQ